MFLKLKNFNNSITQVSKNMQYINKKSIKNFTENNINNGLNILVDPLVTNAKYSPPPAPLGLKKLEIMRGFRVERFKLKRIAEKLLLAKAEKLGLKGIAKFKYHRTSSCLSLSAGGHIQVHKSIKHGKAFYAGLQTCSNVWVCPVCSAKIQIRRVDEIKQAFNWARENNLKAVMITRTFPHTISDRLKDILKKNSIAQTAFRKGKQYDNFKKSLGYEGLIRNLEVTLGVNGWHPHVHELWFVNKNADVEYIEKFILNKWRLACLKAGLLPEGKEDAFLRHSVDVIDNCRESDYLAKQANIGPDMQYWGADKEIAQASSKNGRKMGKTIFQILAEAEDNPLMAEKFIEFAEAMRGKHQLDWSSGLKDKVGVENLTDEEINEQQEDRADLVVNLTKTHWKIVLENEARAEILDIAEDQGFEGVKNWFLDYGLQLDKPLDNT